MKETFQKGVEGQTKIRLADVVVDPELQPRVQMNEELIQDLTAIYEQKKTLADCPIRVWPQDDGRFLLVDGRHRLEAARRAGVEEINAIQPPTCGTPYDRQKAVYDAVFINAHHGLRLTRSDVSRAVELLIENAPELSVEEICAAVGRSKSVVYECLNQLSRAGKLKQPETRRGKDGKLRPTSYAKREPKPVKIEMDELAGLDEFEKTDELEGADELDETVEFDWSDAMEKENETPERNEAEKEGREAREPAPMARCAGGCGRLVSSIYLEELQALGRQKDDWLERDGEWFCSEECAADETARRDGAKLKQRERELEERLEEQTILLPCPKCGGRPTVEVNLSIEAATVFCRDCGHSFGFFNPPEKAVEVWREEYARELKAETATEAETTAKAETATDAAPCPICGEQPTIEKLAWTDWRKNWLITCCGEDHHFRVYGSSKSDALAVWDTIFEPQRKG